MPKKRKNLSPPRHDARVAWNRLFKPLRTRNSEQNAPTAYLSLENETPVELPIPPKKDTKENIRDVKTPKRKRSHDNIDEPGTSSTSPLEPQPSTSSALPPEDMDYEESNDGLDQIEVVSVEALNPAEAMEMSFDDPPSNSEYGILAPSSSVDGPVNTAVQKTENDAVQTDIVNAAPEEVHNSSQDSTADEVVSALDTFFRDVYNDFKSNDEEWQRRWTLIPEFAQECIEKINTCSPSGVDEVLRWYARSQGWRPRLKKSLEDDFRMLVDRGIVKKFGEKVEIKFEEVLDIMSRDEMTKFAQRQLVGKTGSMDAMKAKLLASFKEGLRVNPVTKKRRADFLLLSAKRAVEGRYQLSHAHSESLNIFFLLHSPSLVQHRIEDATSVAQGIIQSISRFGMKAPLPDTIEISSPSIIQSYKDGNFLLSALKLKIAVQNAMALKDWTGAEEQCDIARKRFSQFRSNFREVHEAHVALPHYLFRLTVSGVFVKIAYFRIEILEKLKKFMEAADAIKAILWGDCHFPDKFNHRRGKLWIRLILNLQHVNAKPNEMTEILEKALKDESLNEVTKAELEVRMEKFLHKGALGGIQLEGWTVVKGEAVRLSSKSGVKEHSKKWITTIDGNQFVETVEHLGLRMIKHSHNLDSGEHAEGSIFSTIFSLIFHDIIYANVPGVFISKYQEGPLDFYSPAFYLNRQEQIEKRLEALEEDFEAVLKDVIELYETVPSIRPIIGVGHHPDRFSASRLEALCKCLGGDALSNIIRRLLKDSSYRSGMPDLIAWSSSGEEGRYLFCEVKAPNDTLSYGQKLWLKYLMSKEVRCQLLQIAEA